MDHQSSKAADTPPKRGAAYTAGRGRVHDGSAPPGAAVVDLTPRSLNALYLELWRDAVEPSVAKLGWFIALAGKITALPPTSYTSHYNVPLQGNDDETTYLTLPRRLVESEKIQPGDYVKVKGRVVADCHRGEMRFRLDVVEIQHAESPEAVQLRQREELTLAKVRALAATRHPFPLKQNLTVSLIRPISQQVREDFVRALGPVVGHLHIDDVPVPMNDAAQIVSALNAAQGDVVVIVRGGGADEDFRVFESASIATALEKKQAFRLLGIGHSTNTTLLDFVADHAATTPTAAGTFLRTQLEAYAEVLRLRKEAVEQERRNQAQATQTAKTLHAEALERAELKSARLQEEISKLRNEVGPTQKREQVYRTAAIAFGLLLVGLIAFLVAMLR